MTLKRTPFKRKAKKRIEGYHDQKMLDACRGQQCYLKVPGVCRGSATQQTVVPAHSNQSKHGKGMGIKARDEFTVPACVDCHSFIDANTTGATRQEKFELWDEAHRKWVPVRDEILNRSD